MKKEEICVFVRNKEEFNEVYSIVNLRQKNTVNPDCFLLNSAGYNPLRPIVHYLSKDEHAGFWMSTHIAPNKVLISIYDFSKILLPHEGQEERFVL